MRKRQLLSAEKVARMIGWSADSVRTHSVPLEEWEEKGRYESGLVPSLRLGERRLIPRWWVEKMVGKASPAATPAAATMEDR